MSEPIASWSQQSCADATTTSEAIASSPEATKGRAIGSIASDSASKKANIVRPMRMRFFEPAGNIDRAGWLVK